MKILLLFSYLIQIYIALIGIILMPFYLKNMGVEAFGLIGFFLTLQSWLQLLDFGLSSTLSREMSLYRAGAISATIIWQRLHSLEWLSGLIAFTTITGLVLLRNLIVNKWLTFQYLSSDTVSICIIFMAITAALRWLMGLYRAALVGLERQIWVNSASGFFSTVKFVGVMPLIIYWSADPLTFFAYQGLIGILEFLTFFVMVYRVLPKSSTNFLPRWDAIQPMLAIAGPMAFITSTWIFLTQIDRLILSKTLTLEEYGYFTLATMAASSVLMLVPPLNQVLQPRITILASQGKDGALQNLYRLATQFITPMFLAIGGTLALFSEPILLAWTNNLQVAKAAAPILFWYGLANALVGILVLPFMVQFAWGYLRLHIIGNILLIFVLLPVLIYTSITQGGVGAGLTLFTARLLFLLFWIPVVHRRLMPKLVFSWLLFDLGPAFFAVLGTLIIGCALFPTSVDRLSTLILISIIFLAALIAGLLTGDLSREEFLTWIKKLTSHKKFP